MVQRDASGNFSAGTITATLNGNASYAAGAGTATTAGSATTATTAGNVTGTVAVANGGTGTTNGSITGTDALTFAAGGTDKNVTLTPSGAGSTVLGGAVGIGAASPNAASILDVTSTTKGFLPPRMTSDERTAIATPVIGLTVFDTDIKDIMTYNGTGWVTSGSSSSSGVTSVSGSAPINVVNGTSTPVISIPVATSGQAGYLSAADWSTFNSKGSGTVTGVSTSAPLTGSFTTSGTVGINKASTSQDGYLAAADFTNFNTAFGWGSPASYGYLKADGTVAATGNLNLNTHLITNLAGPSAATDAANKSYVDSIAAGLAWQARVINILATPPSSPASGDRYIVGASATGAWTGQDNKIAQWDGSEWLFTAPTNSMSVFATVPSNGYVYLSASSQWVQFSGGANYVFGGGLTYTAPNV